MTAAQKGYDTKLQSTGKMVFAAALGAGATFFDAATINVALPAIGRDFQGSFAGLQWVQSSYLVSITALLVAGGKIGDRIGHRRVFLVGLAILSIGAAVCTGAQSIEQVVFGRFIQGVGAASLIPNSLPLAVAGTHEKNHHNKIIATWAAIVGASGASAPIIGGILVNYWSWRFIFLLVAVISIGAGLIVLALPSADRSERKRSAPSFSLINLLLATLSFGFGATVLIEGPTVGWKSREILLVSILLGALVMVLIARSIATKNLTFPHWVYNRLDFLIVSAVTILIYASFNFFLFALQLRLQQQDGITPLKAGMIVLPIELAIFAISPFMTKLLNRVNTWTPLVAGSLLMSLAFTLLWYTKDGIVASAILGTMLFAAGFGLVVVPINVVILSSAKKDGRASALAFNNAIARMGGLLAISGIPALIAFRPLESDAGLTIVGFRPSMLACAVLCLLAMLLSLAARMENVEKTS